MGPQPLAMNSRSPESNPYLEGVFAPVGEERVLADLSVKGELPRDLNGFFLRNGPNPRFAPPGRYHWFDGDAMIHAVHFEEGRATYRNRYIQTRDFEAENRAGHPLWKGIREPFDPASPSPNKNTANTDLAFHAGRLLAMFWQGADSYEIALPDLETRGVCDFGGSYQGTMTAHPKVDARTGEMMFMDYNVFAEPWLAYGVVGADGRLKHHTPIEVPGPRFFHDLAITENYTILLDLPLIWHTERMKKGKRLAYFDPHVPARFGILPRHGSNADVRWFEDDACYILHVINAFERSGEDGDEIVMYAGRMDNPIPGRRYDPARGPLLHFLQVQPFLNEWRFNLKTGETKRRQLDDRAMEFPRMNDDRLGASARFGYAPLLAPEREVIFEGFIKYDAAGGEPQLYRYGKGLCGGEVVFLPRDGADYLSGAAAEDDGWLGTFVHDRREGSTEFWVMDAANLEAGPLAQVAVPGHVPAGFHATWAPKL